LARQLLLLAANWPHYWPQKSGNGRKEKFLRPAESLAAVRLEGYWPQRTQNLTI
jgi:hypothetical protein